MVKPSNAELGKLRLRDRSFALQPSPLTNLSLLGLFFMLSDISQDQFHPGTHNYTLLVGDFLDRLSLRR